MTESEQRFHNKIEIHQSGCWLWKGHKATNGYGRFWDGKRLIPAHRFLMQKPENEKLEACHKCDVRHCVNPDHLFWGTRSDNMADMVSKGRYNKESAKRNARRMLNTRKIHNGSENHGSKLNEWQASIAKASPPTPGIAAALSREFKVCVSVITRIRDGVSWKHLPEPTDAFKQRAEAFLRTIGKWKD